MKQIKFDKNFSLRESEERENFSTFSPRPRVPASPRLSFRKWWRQKLPLVIFVGMGLNLLIAPVVYAAAGGRLEPYSAWALGILGLVTLALIIYLFVVVFQPERF